VQMHGFMMHLHFMQFFDVKNICNKLLFHWNRENVVLLCRLASFILLVNHACITVRLQYTTNPFLLISIFANCLMMEQVQNSRVPLSSGTVF
jgi:hypothetical protein